MSTSPGKKDSDASSPDKARFTWEDDSDFYIVSQPDEEEVAKLVKEQEEEPPKRSPIVMMPGSPLDIAVQKQIAENKKAGKWGVGKSPLDKHR
jgi:hypothetical protein